MEPESSLSFTQQSVTAVCPEADDCRPQPHSHSSKMNFNLSSQEPHGVLVCPTRATCHTHFIILIIFYEKTWNDAVPIMQFSIPSCYFLLSPDIPLILYSQPLSRILTVMWKAKFRAQSEQQAKSELCIFLYLQFLMTRWCPWILTWM